MRLSTYLREIGRPIAYYPRLAKILGGVKAAVLVSQLSYWSDKTTNPRGIYKTSEEIENETGLSYKEQRAARQILKEKKVLRENYDRLNHRMFFLVDFDVLDVLWANYLENNELPKVTFGNVEKCDSGTTECYIRERTKGPLDITKTTTESTTENSLSESEREQIFVMAEKALNGQKLPRNLDIRKVDYFCQHVGEKKINLGDIKTPIGFIHDYKIGEDYMPFKERTKSRQKNIYGNKSEGIA